jgi:hypothetical protein
MSQGVWAQEFGEMPEKPSTGVSSENERRAVYQYLTGIGIALREVREMPEFWHSLGPAFRVRFEDFQGDLAALRAAWRK